jgi:Holliday junction resolvase-like predicted endonuclease
MHNLEGHATMIERNLIIAVLKLTKSGPVSHELINKELRIPLKLCQKLLDRLQNEGLIYSQGPFIVVDSINRLKLAVQAINLGADPERVSGFLQWKEFEAISALILERNGYVAARNLRFKHDGRRWEIDVVAYRKPLVICADCKHWHHGINPSTLRSVVREQVERARALAECLQDSTIKIGCSSWNSAKAIPAVFSLTANGIKLFENVPVVSIFQLQDFLDQLPAYADSLEHFSAMKHSVDGWLSHKP